MQLPPASGLSGRSEPNQTSAPPSPSVGLRDVLRGLWAVLALVFGAALELVTALVGLPNPRRYVRDARRAVAEAWRDGVNDIHEADVIDIGEDIER